MSLKTGKTNTGGNKKNVEKKEGKRKTALSQGNKGEKKIKKKMRFEFKSNLSSGVPDKNARCDGKPDTRRGETGVKSEMSEKSQMLSKDESCPEFFGVRSYLHNFYESVSIRNPQLYEDIYDDEMIYLNNTRKYARKDAVICWKFNMGLGAFALGLGVILILVGYLTPLHEGIKSHQEDYVIVDRDAAKFNYYIKVCRMMGLISFCGGGCIFSIALLVSFFFNMNYTEEEEDDPLEPLCVTLDTEDVPQTPTDKKIPATEELTSVQPKREVEEVVMTNSGLCKPPAQKGNSGN
ncbi:neurensin-1-like [Uloborus diversus]|uniref:neurensin-1-like n=1 Tax=Uloborus diversus TaxID=327109 RepID=UPI0024093B6D|nr:neurensin-1-like [Uloborus diversus]